MTTKFCKRILNNFMFSLCLFVILHSSFVHSSLSSTLQKSTTRNNTQVEKKSDTSANVKIANISLPLKATGYIKQTAKNLTTLPQLENEAGQSRPNRNIGNSAAQHNTPKPSLWEIFKTNLFPKSQVETSVSENVDSVTAGSQITNNYETQDQIPASSDISESVWNPLENWRSAARKSIVFSFLSNFGKNHLTSNHIDKPEVEKTHHHNTPKSPVDLELNFNIDPNHKHGKLIHDSLKTFLRVQNSILNHVLGKHGQPLLKTVETPKEPSLHDLVIKPFSDLLQSHSSIHTNTINHSPKHNVDQHPADSATSHSENRPFWSAWEAYPWKKSPAWDPWSYNYHIQRPETEGSIVKFWKPFLWGALRAKKNIAVTTAKFLPLIATIKVNTLKRVLERIAHREQSPTFLLLRIIRNALWKGKKAFLKRFLQAKEHVTSFRSKLKYFKQPTEKPTNSYGDGQDISQVHLTYAAPEASPAPDSYHSSISRPVPSSWSSSSQSSVLYDLLPPVIATIEDNQPAFSSQTVSSTTKPNGFKFSLDYSKLKPVNSNKSNKDNYLVSSSTAKPEIIYTYTSDSKSALNSNNNYGELVPVPFTSVQTYSSPTSKFSTPTKKDESFSAKLLQLRLKH